MNADIRRAGRALLDAAIAQARAWPGIEQVQIRPISFSNWIE